MAPSPPRHHFAPGLMVGRFLAWALGLLLISPVIYILWGLLSSQTGESWPHVRDYLVADACQNTIILVAGTGFLTLLLGVPAAWFISQYRFPGRRLFSILLVLPLAVPPYIAAYITTDAREALIPWLVEIRQEKGVETYLRVELFLRYFWLTLILAGTLFPYVFLASRAVFTSRSRRLGEACRLLGANPWRAFWTIHLPLVRPALVAGLFLVSMEVISDYGAAKHLGISTLTVTIFRTWFGLDELATARYLAGWVLVGILALVAFERWQRGRARFSGTHGTTLPLKEARPQNIVCCWLVCGLPVLLGFIYPLTVLVQWHLADTQSSEWSRYFTELGQTLSLGLGATTSCVLISLFLLAMARFSRRKPDRLLTQTVATVGYASPGTVMAVGVLGVAAGSRELLGNDHWAGPLLLSGSFLWILFALTARYLTVSSQVLSSGYETIPPAYDHSARLLGRTLPQVFRTIHLPLLRAPLLGGAVLVFVDVSKELPLTLLLRPFDFETLGTTAYSLANQGRIFETATPSLLLILLSGLSLLFVEFFGWKNTPTPRQS